MHPEEFVARCCQNGPIKKNVIYERGRAHGIGKLRVDRLLTVALDMGFLFSWPVGREIVYDIEPKEKDRDEEVSGDVLAKIPSPKEFRASLLIDKAGEVGPLEAEGWQEADFAALDQAWHDLVLGTYTEGVKRRAWIERPRGHSKTSDLAVMCAYAMAYSVRPVVGVACAADQEQAKLLKAAIEKLAGLNRGIFKEKELEVLKDEIKSRNGSNLKFLSSDVATSWGHLPDFVVCDEVSHWKEAGSGLWESMSSAAGKRKNCIMTAITNAGFMESWQWELRERCRALDWWYFSSMELKDDQAPQSWLAPEFEKQKKELPPLVFERLWLNRWSSGAGDALQAKDIAAAITLSGPVYGAEDGWSYYGGIDLSVSRDTSALVVVGKKAGRIHLTQVRAWKPPKGGKIDFAEVRQTIYELNGVFHPKWMTDPFQAEAMIQDLQGVGVLIEAVQFVGKNLQEMAAALIEYFSAHHIEIYNDAALIVNLKRLRLVESSSGYRLEASRTSEGHADRATAFALAVLGARRAGNAFFGLDAIERPGRTINDMAPSGVYLDQRLMEEQADPYDAIHGGPEFFDDGPSVVPRDAFGERADYSRWGPPE